MNSHAPTGYICPFCLVVQGEESPHVLTRQSDIVYQDQTLTAFICSHAFPHNAGHTLIIPNRHYENIYYLPDLIGQHLFTLARSVARSMKAAYECDGITVWQSNEVAGDQTVWHYHLHVIPRFVNDAYFHNLAHLAQTYRLMPPEQRAMYATTLRTHLGTGSLSNT